MSDALEPITSLGKRFPKSADEMKKLKEGGVRAAKRLLGFIDASPTPYHVTANIARQLKEDGFERLREQDSWSLMPGYRRYVVRDDSTIVAFVVGKNSPALSGFHIIGAHTDSPTMQVKPLPERCKNGYQQLGVEVYGGAILPTWVDRDLSIAGRVICSRDGAIESTLIDLRKPVARIPSLAIHLDRQVNTEGMVLNKQNHMVPVVGLGDALDLKDELARVIGCPPEDVIGFDLSLYDVQKGAICGLADEFIHAGRIDNLFSCHAATEALSATPDGTETTAVIVLYNHEECGSRSAVGAQSSMLRDIMTRVALAYPGAEHEAGPRALSRSMLVSADMAHAVHPNYADKHDSEHAPKLNQGLVIKTNANQSYATTGASAARFTEVCHAVGYEPQHFVSRGDLPCGSTIGPITAAAVGIQTVDVGAPMLSMHSIRELAGTLDVQLALKTFIQFFR